MRISPRRCLMTFCVAVGTCVFISDFMQTWIRLQPHAQTGPHGSPLSHASDNGSSFPFLRYLVNSVMGPLRKRTSNKPHVWPSLMETDDRIVAQLNYVPRGYNKTTSRLRSILVMTGLNGAREGQYRFKESKCVVDRCLLTTDKSRARYADAVLWQNDIFKPPFPKFPHHIWIYFQLESPFHSASLYQFNHRINWTSNYRADSTIVAPYEKFVPFANASTVFDLPKKNYATGKSKQVAWFVSNCNAKNKRLEYALELAQYINVDIYGACGTYTCYRSNMEDCNRMLSKDYKFYLSFENSNCKDYITEKFFWNGLKNDILPIVMGASPEAYKRVAPPESFLHVDQFKSPEQLAEYLHVLDKDDGLYNKYFRWKDTGRFIDTKYWCRLCAMLHDDRKITWHADINHWWDGPQVCEQEEPKRRGLPAELARPENVITEIL